jgi:putative PEP-CTERM system TPR-repeat lipoprotein
MSHKNRIARHGLIGTLLLGAVLAAGCNKQTPASLVAEAKTYQQKGDDKAAIIQLKNALQAAPDNVEARYLLGTLYARNGDPASAEKELRRALALGMNPAQVKPEIARALFAQGEYQKVLDDTAADPQTAPLLAMRGNAFLALNRFDDAKASFNRAAELKPDLPEALIGQGKSAVADKDLTAATQYSDQAIAKNPQNPEAWIFRGDLLRTQRKVPEALAAYDSALKLQPTNSSIRIVKANLEITAGKFADARADIEAARKIAPNSLGVLYVQALLEFSEGRNAAALETIQKVLRGAPDHMPSVLLAGSIQYALGATQQSEQDFKKYLTNNPGNMYASKMLAASLMKNGDTTHAITLLEPALQRNPQDPQLWLLAGETHMKARNFVKANEYFNKANQLAPGASAVHTALGMSKLAQGDADDGVSELEKAAAMNDKSPQAGVMLVATYMRQKQFDKAMAAAKALEKTDPKNPLPLNLQGGIHMARNDKAAARAVFGRALALQPNYFPAVSNLAQIDVSDKKFDDARKRLETYLAANKKDLQAMVALANVAVAAGKPDEAAATLERAVAENPDSVQAMRALASYYMQSNQKAKAVTMIAKMQKARPTDTEVLELLAQAQMQSGDTKSALDSYTRLAAANPESAPTQFRIAAIQMQLKDTNAAAASLDRALRLDPNYPEAQAALANVEAGRGNYEAALVAARKLQAQQANAPGGYVLEGDILGAKGDFAGAIKPYERAVALDNSGIALRKLHFVLTRAGKGAEADARLQKWLVAHPGDVQTRMYVAQNAIGTAQNKSAVTQLEAVVRDDPKNAAALNNLALAYQQEKDARALATAEKAYALLPDNAAVIDTLGWVLSESGNTARGLPLLHKANTLSPRSSEIRFHLAQALAKSGDKAAARKELSMLIESDEKFARLDDAKALMKQL